MLHLFDNAFSPFARKVRLVLDYKGLTYEVTDGLRRSNHDALAAVNSRIEVPCLTDGDVTVVNSSDIVGYLEHRYPDRPVYPSDPGLRVRARAWERTADSHVDSILADVSLWMWARKGEPMPSGLVEAARADLDAVFGCLERDLQTGPFVCGELSIADFALFPHMTGLKALDVSFSAEDCPRLAKWFKTMRGMDICLGDMKRARDFLVAIDDQDIETERIFWRGDRIEWLLAKGYEDWFFEEIKAGRVAWPGPSLPIDDAP